MSEKKEVRSKLEAGLITAMQALDNQIARSVERTPEQREEHGVQKWEPMAQRVEQICVLLINALGDEEIRLDSVVVLAQALSKALFMIVDDLEGVDLGQVRTAYCLDALENILNDAERAKKLLKGEAELM